MLRNICLLLLGLLYGTVCFGQLKAVSRARVVTGAGTLEGYVRNSSKTATPQYFDFAETESGPFRRLTADGLLRVELEDSTVFERHHVRMPVLSKPVENRQQSDYTASVYFEGGALLEQLVDGSRSLFVCTDSFEVAHFFFREGADTAVLAIRYEPYEDKSERGLFAYRNDLERLGIAAGCGESVRSEVNYVGYDTRSMITYFQTLNACAGAPARVVGRLNAKSAVTRFGILLGGLRRSQLLLLPFGEDARVASYGFAVGGWIDFLPRQRNTNLMIGMDLGMSFTGGNNGDGSKVLRYPYVEVSSNLLFFDFTVRRLFCNSAVRPFLEGGLALNIGKAETHYQALNPTGGTEVRTYGSGGTRTEVLGGGGIYFPAGSLHLRYHQPFIGENALRNNSLSLTARIALRR